MSYDTVEQADWANWHTWHQTSYIVVVPQGTALFENENRKTAPHPRVRTAKPKVARATNRKFNAK